MLLQPHDVVTTCDVAYDVRRLCAVGRYVEAIGLVKWPPNPKSNDPRSLLAWGVITTSKSSAEQAHDQELAKDLLSKAVRLFGGDPSGPIAEVYLALAYWRLGEVSNALARLDDVLSKETCPEAQFGALLSKAIIDSERTEHRHALESLKLAEPFLDLIPPEGRGKYYNQKATALSELAAQRHSVALRDSAIIEFTAALIEFEKSGARDLRAAVKNNLAWLYALNAQFADAYKYVNRALVLVSDDLSIKGRILDQRARIYLLEGKPAKAESDCKRAVSLFESGEQLGCLAECLITYGTALARTNNPLAISQFERALDLASELEDKPLHHKAIAEMLIEVRLPYVRVFELFSELEMGSADRSLVVRAGAGVQLSIEAERIRFALDANDGRVVPASRWLEISHVSLINKISNHYPELETHRREKFVRRKSVFAPKK